MPRRAWWVMFVACCLIASANPVEANDHLEPIDKLEEPLEPYDQMLRDVFREAYSPTARATVAVIPSFSPETVTAIIQSGSRYEVISATPTVHLWAFETLRMMENGQIRRIDANAEAEQAKEIDALRRRLPASPRDVPLKRCTRQISLTAATAAIEAWDMMLTDLRPNDEIIMDGVSFEFSMPPSGKQGKANTPVTGRTRKLADLAGTLEAYCHGRRSEFAITRLAKSIKPIEPQ